MASEPPFLCFSPHLGRTETLFPEPLSFCRRLLEVFVLSHPTPSPLSLAGTQRTSDRSTAVAKRYMESCEHAGMWCCLSPSLRAFLVCDLFFACSCSSVPTMALILKVVWRPRAHETPPRHARPAARASLMCMRLCARSCLFSDSGCAVVCSRACFCPKMHVRQQQLPGAFFENFV